MSSYLSKSKKDFKPKIPARRPGASGLHGVVRGSVERQLQSQTPQPALSRASLTPALSNVSDKFISAASQEPKALSPVATNSEAGRRNAQVRVSRARRGRESSRDGRRAATDLATFSAPIDRSPSRGFQDGDQTASSVTVSGEQVLRDVEIHIPVEQHDKEAVSISIPQTRRSGIRQENAAPLFQASEQVTIPAESLQLLVEATAIHEQRRQGSPVTPQSERNESIPQPSKRRRLSPSQLRPPSASPAISAIVHPYDLAPSIEVPDSHIEAVGQTNRQGAQKTPAAKSKSRSKKTAEQAPAHGIDMGGGGGQAKKTKKRKSKGEDIGGESRKARRQMTPEGNEDVEILPEKVSMGDLTVDDKYGKKSMRLKRLHQRDVEQRQRKLDEARRKSELGTNAEEIENLNAQQAGNLCNTGGNSEGNNAGTGVVQPRQVEDAADTTHVNRLAPRLRIVHGQIVQDEDSVRIDRHQDAQEDANATTTIEDDLSRKVNSANYIKRESGQRWTVELTERFFDGLRMFGTDFGMISKMFPGFSRAKVKLKFVKEEKRDEAYIKQVLLGERKAVDMEEFEKLSRITFQDPKELETQLEDDKKRLEEEQTKEKEAMDEANRRRQEEADAEAAAVVSDDVDHEEAAGNHDLDDGDGRKGKRKRGRKIQEQNGEAIKNSVEEAEKPRRGQRKGLRA